VVAAASTGSAAPDAMPTAVVSHTDAAVVSPRTASRRTKIRPPPMNPIPETICAATRDGSRTTPCPTTSENPYLDTSMISAELNPITVWVRSPALFCRTSRSRPMIADRKSATARSKICSQPWPNGSPNSRATAAESPSSGRASHPARQARVPLPPVRPPARDR
jgi:hypothetical protein